MHDYFGQQFAILLEYKDSLDDYLDKLDEEGKGDTKEYKTIDELIYKIIDLRDDMGQLKNKIENDYPNIIYF